MKVVITRPTSKAKSLISGLHANSIDTWELPLVDIRGRIAPEIYQKFFDQINTYDKVIFLSQHAVEHCPFNILHRIRDLAIDVFTVGIATKLALGHKGLHDVYMPDGAYSSEGLLDLALLENVQDEKILVIKGKGGRRILMSQLKERGAVVSELYTYERYCPKIDIKPLLHAVQDHEIDWVVCTSMAAVENLIRLFGKNGWQILRNMPLLVISQRMKLQLKKLGFKKEPLVSENATNDSILSLLTSHMVKEKQHV